LKLSPAVENLTAPLCTSDIIGKLSVSGDRCDITLVDGTLDGWTVLTPDSIKYVYVNDILYNN
jgi:hypothetical protein